MGNHQSQQTQDDQSTHSNKQSNQDDVADKFDMTSDIEIDIDSDDLYREPQVTKKIKQKKESKKSSKKNSQQKNVSQDKEPQQNQDNQLTLYQLNKLKKAQHIERIRQIDEDLPEYYYTDETSSFILKKSIKNIEEIIVTETNYQQAFEKIKSVILKNKIRNKNLIKVLDYIKNIAIQLKDKLEMLFFIQDNIVKEFFDLKPMIERTFFFPSQENVFEFAKILKKAKQTMDIAIFAFTNDILKKVKHQFKALLYAHRQGCKIRIITDDECSKFQGADIYELAADGIQCTMDNNKRYHMHNKFVIIDKLIIATGSFNWTQQAANGNQENLLVLHNERLVEEYQREFDNLWVQFQPNMLDKQESQKLVDEENRKRSEKIQIDIQKTSQKKKIKQL